MYKVAWIALGLVSMAVATLPVALAEDPVENPHAVDPAEAAELSPEREAELISEVRQITFDGKRAGEGYFSADARQMVFQSERDADNPFYQIYLMDLETADVQRVSPGMGKTTCAWIHPDGEQVLFASTHHDPESVAKQNELLELRREGKQPRYAWDYDPEFELYERSADGELKRLTDAKGYDAEGSYSPDGKQIVFASNRAAYSQPMSPREQQLFEIDKAYMIDLYIMNADGTHIRQLTDEAGYDGGPFFSADGKRICWRRFSEDGATAEVYSMKTDGTDVKRLTSIGAMSWAPYFHPSGDYLIFTTNKHGFGNFELYCVRADGAGQPVRVTYTDGFDGLPVFLPDGKHISWTSNRTAEKQSQIFLGEWNDTEIRKRLGLDNTAPSSVADRDAALAAADQSTPEFSPADVARHVDYLCRPELGGRLTGTDGERRATAYVAAYLESLGYLPAGSDGTYFHSFEFPAGSQLTGENTLTVGDKKLTVETDWQPLSFSNSGATEPAEVVFAGYGMRVPGNEEVEEYDSYVHLDVAGKWVLVLRDLPQEISAERRQQLARYSSPRRKATVARDAGALGIIFAAGPTSKVKNELIRFDRDASQANISIPVISVTNAVAESLFAGNKETLQAAQAKIDDGSMQMGFALPATKVAVTVSIERKTGTGRNVLARLPAGDEINWDAPVVMVGAHIDHLGRGGGSNSLAKDDERDQVHVGADDNASGVGVMLEIAQYIANEKSTGRLAGQRDLIIAAWSGEELGLFGSQAFVQSFQELYPNAPQPDAETDDVSAAHAHAHAHGSSESNEPLTQAISAYLNLDMVGRMSDKLIIQGIGSSPKFAAEVQRRNVPVGLKLQLDKTSTGLPTDASAFVTRGVPILSAFTGAHSDYHTPRDTPDKLDYESAAKIGRLFALITRGLLTSETTPEFQLDEGEKQKDAPRVRLTAYLGTIPDYAAGEVVGAQLSGVAADGPAAKAGVKGGDVIIELAGRKVEDLYDFTYAIEALKIGQETEIVVKRGEETLRLKVTPGSRD
ncbi:M28 family peptidase [Stieleria varia]|nr:M28 family peptidase [Stieleria varia]